MGFLFLLWILLFGICCGIALILLSASMMFFCARFHEEGKGCLCLLALLVVVFIGINVFHEIQTYCKAEEDNKFYEIEAKQVQIDTTYITKEKIDTTYIIKYIRK